uniref:hypothetical protein n=1 Tax=Ningiella ruwaisensis TaxID=2364274 RepID=UPI0010A03EB4|nr:hypothetical protein [Ningiella ruwaisensis]
MTKSYDTTDSNSPILDMSALKTAIVNNEEHKVKEMLAQQQLDNLQQQYLVELAKTNNNPRLAEVIENTPSKP